MRRFLILLPLLVLFVPLRAQNFLARSQVGLMGGGMTYIGDLNDQSMFGKPNLAGGLLPASTSTPAGLLP